jgi:hypothetical protein
VLPEKVLLKRAEECLSPDFGEAFLSKWIIPLFLSGESHIFYH